MAFKVVSGDFTGVAVARSFLPGGGVYGAVSKRLSNVCSAIKLTVTSVIGKNK